MVLLGCSPAVMLAAALGVSYEWDELQVARILGFDGAYKVSHWSETVDTEANRGFIKGYYGHFGEAPNSTAALTYDAFHILFEAAAAAGLP